ncbi:MAG: threonine synthase [Leptospirales bacterium]|nr:threonine synthase [Leptospirales bacterium]
MIPPAISGLKAVLRCIECGRQYSLHVVLYRCQHCDGLLEVFHDVSALQATPAQEWKQLFEGRMSDFCHPWNSGVWGKREWVLPEIDDQDIVSHSEGRSPLSELHELAHELDLSRLWIKQCGISHTGSFKDLGMTVLVSHVRSLIRRGISIRAVACASTGDTSAALAAYAAAAGIPTIVFLPAGKITTAQLVQPLASGAIVLSLDTDFDGCMEVVQAITADQSIYLANSMNPLRIEGQKTVSIELVQQLGWQAPDWVIIPGGNLGNVSALGAGFKLLRDCGLIDRLPRICVAQSERANPLYLSFQKNFSALEPVKARTTLASAIQIGNPVSYPRAVRTLREFEGVVEQASEEELAEASARTDRFGQFCDPHTGVALAALFKLRQQGAIKAQQSVALISTAHGLKFSDFKIGYHEGRLSDVGQQRYRNMPVALPADIKRVRAALAERLGK